MRTVEEEAEKKKNGNDPITNVAIYKRPKGNNKKSHRPISHLIKIIMYECY